VTIVYWVASLPCFALQGPLMMVEGSIKRWVRGRGVEMPAPWLMRPIIVPLMLWVGLHLFFAPAVVDTDIADRVVQACQKLYLSLFRGLDGLGSFGILTRP